MNSRSARRLVGIWMCVRSHRELLHFVKMARRWVVPDIQDALGNTSPQRQIIFPKQRLLEETEGTEEAGEVYSFPNTSDSVLQDLSVSTSIGHQQMPDNTSPTLQTSLHSGSNIEGKSFRIQ